MGVQVFGKRVHPPRPYIAAVHRCFGCAKVLDRLTRIASVGHRALTCRRMERRDYSERLGRREAAFLRRQGYGVSLRWRAPSA